jgi:hypothetical protein
MNREPRDSFRTHVIIDQSHREVMQKLRHEIGNVSACVRRALDQYLPQMIEDVSHRAEQRKQETMMALELQKKRAEVQELEGIYSSRLDDFRAY